MSRSKRKTVQYRRKRASSDALLRISAAGDMLLAAAILGAVVLFSLWPVFCIFLRSMQGGESLFSQYAAVWQDYRSSLYNSVFVAVFASLGTTLLAVLCALYLSAAKGWQRKLFMFILLVAMVSPPFVSSLSYIQLYGRRGWITYRLLGISRSPYNRWGVIAMEILSFAPVNILLLRSLLDRTDRGSLMAARDLGAGPAQILRDIVLPTLRPGIIVSLLLAFVRSAADFSTPMIIGGRFTTLASDIYLQIAGYANLEKASAMNMFLLLPSLAAFFLYRHFMKQTEGDNTSRTVRGGIELPLYRCGLPGIASLLAAGSFSLLMFLQYGCIFLSGFLKSSKGVYSFTLEHLQKLLSVNSSTLVRSVEYSLAIAVFGSLFAMLFAYYVENRRIPGYHLWDAMAAIPYMIPGTCFGLGYILAFNHAPLKLTGTAFIVLANMLFKQLPTTSRICAASMKGISAEQIRSARDLGGGRLAVLRDVILPNMRQAFLACFIYNFSGSMTTAGAILFLITARRKLAVFVLFDAVTTGDYAKASIIASCIIVTVLLFEGLAALLLRKAGGTDVSGTAWSM